jgi:uncharacterized protein YjbK
MSQEVEIEYKNLLTKEEYDQLLKKLPFPSAAKKQVNYYFETKDFALAKQHCALRIREKNDNYTLTLKEPHEEGLLETHDQMSKQEAESWIQGTLIPKPNIARQLEHKGISIKDLTFFGELVTERRETEYENVLIVLDYSTYNHTEDYEFELEAPAVSIGKKKFHSILKQFNIPERNTPNKIQRFFSSQKNNT